MGRTYGTHAKYYYLLYKEAAQMELTKFNLFHAYHLINANPLALNGLL